MNNRRNFLGQSPNCLTAKGNNDGRARPAETTKIRTLSTMNVRINTTTKIINIRKIYSRAVVIFEPHDVDAGFDEPRLHVRSAVLQHGTYHQDRTVSLGLGAGPETVRKLHKNNVQPIFFFRDGK